MRSMRNIELLGGDLRHRGQHALADLDPAGENRHLARRRETRPTGRARDCASSGPGSGSAHRRAPARMRGGRLLDRAQDAVVRAAAADIVVERLRDLGARRRRVPVEQRLGGDQDAGQAIAALAGLLVEKGLLQRVRPVGAAEPLDRRDRFAGDGRHAALPQDFSGCAVDQHHAAAALLEPAAESRAHQAEMVAQHVEQRRLFVVERHADGLAVDRKFEVFGHARS